MRKPSLSSVVVSMGLGLVGIAACGGDDGYQPPGQGVDAAPSDAKDAAVDSPVDGNPIDAPGETGAPVITLITPDVGALVAGILRLEVEVTDADGVKSVTATIAGNNTIPMASTAGTNKWVGFYNTMPLANLVAPTIIVRATDQNDTTSQLGFAVTLDNQPPIASLDPARVRATKIVQGEQLCSADFDPLGGDAPNDTTAVPQLVEFRARVRDVPNTGSVNGTLFIPYAGIDTVQLFVFDDTTKPLVVDGNGDGVCDRINPNIVPAGIPMVANEAAVVAMTGLSGGGAADYVFDSFGGSNNAVCSVGTDIAPHDPLCFGELAVTSIIDTPFTNEPEIFGVPPVTTSNCMGFAFDARASNISDGWACAAVLVTDKLGNQSVSSPLRICVDSNGDNSNGCANWGQPSASPPDCTGTLTGTTVTTTACTARKFFTPTVANEYELIEP